MYEIRTWIFGIVNGKERVIKSEMVYEYVMSRKIRRVR